MAELHCCDCCRREDATARETQLIASATELAGHNRAEVARDGGDDSARLRDNAVRYLNAAFEKELLPKMSMPS